MTVTVTMTMAVAMAPQPSSPRPSPAHHLGESGERDGAPDTEAATAGWVLPPHSSRAHPRPLSGPRSHQPGFQPLPSPAPFPCLLSHLAHLGHPEPASQGRPPPLGAHPVGSRCVLFSEKLWELSLLRPSGHSWCQAPNEGKFMG